MKRNSSCKHTCTHISIIPILFSAVSGPLPPFVPVFSYLKKKDKVHLWPLGYFFACVHENVWLTSAPVFSVLFHSSSVLSLLHLSFPEALVLSLSASCPLLPSAVPPFSFPPLLSGKYSLKLTSVCFCFVWDIFYIFRENVLMLKVNVSVLSLNSIVTSRPF